MTSVRGFPPDRENPIHPFTPEKITTCPSWPLPPCPMLYMCVTLGGFEQCCQHSLCVAPESCVCNRLRWILNSSFLQGRKVIACRASSGRIRCLQPASRLRSTLALPAHYLLTSWLLPSFHLIIACSHCYFLSSLLTHYLSAPWLPIAG